MKKVDRARNAGSSHHYDWASLLSTARVEPASRKSNIRLTDHRTAHERDFDRVVFCTPVRRMKDKTQVFPLDMHDGVRTRLTHSMEVSNLARSMGVAVCVRCERIRKIKDAERNVPALLGAIALVHDLGNPPFGHQGEIAIRNWIKKNQNDIKKIAGREFSKELLRDFLLFEGNAQGFRVLTRLQHLDHKAGLRLTASTLRAFMKYPWGSNRVSEQRGIDKFGVFKSEYDIFNWACRETALAESVRHPISYLMEVCDDIAYSVLDIEDAVKKEIISAADVVEFLHSFEVNERLSELLEQYEEDEQWLRSITMPKNSGNGVDPISSKEYRDSLIEVFRSYLIGVLVSDAIDRFLELEASHGFSNLRKGIAENFRSSSIIAALKKFAKLRVYRHRDVLKAELSGHRVIPRLMDAMWHAVVAEHRKKQTKMDEYVISVMSPNYIRVYRQSEDLGLPTWYRQIQLVSDQVCGMSDSHALRVHDELQTLGCLHD
jgi:dGTPase